MQESILIFRRRHVSQRLLGSTPTILNMKPSKVVLAICPFLFMGFFKLDVLPEPRIQPLTLYPHLAIWGIFGLRNS